MIRHIVYGLVLIFASVASAQSPPGAVVQTWHYDSTKKVLTLRVVNTSHKDITAYNISLTVKYTDGRTNFSEVTKEFLPLVATMREVGDSDENLRRQYGNGTFAAETSRDDAFPQQPTDVADVTAILDVVAYADGTADVQNERAFNHLVDRRKGRLLAMQKANAVIQQVLADPTVTKPSAAAATELTQLADVSRGLNRSLEEGQIVPDEVELRAVARDLQNAPVAASRTGMTERDYLGKYVADSQNRLAITSAQVNLTKTGVAQ